RVGDRIEGGHHSPGGRAERLQVGDRNADRGVPRFERNALGARGGREPGRYQERQPGLLANRLHLTLPNTNRFLQLVRIFLPTGCSRGATVLEPRGWSSHRISSVGFATPWETCRPRYSTP